MIRRATAEDATDISRIYVAARDEMTYLPRIDDETRPKLGGWFLDRWPMWVAEQEGRVVGFVSLSESMIEQIYVDPAAQNRGIGTALMDLAKRERPNRLELWVFQQNERARRFYRRHGFRLVALTDGSGNMEKTPDAKYEWTSSG